MMKSAALVILGLVATLELSLGQANQTIDFKNPVRSAEEDRISSLNGRTYPYKQYSGYLNADSLQPPNRFWHYWFVESQSDPSKDPIVLWLNGGPGCSSLLGLLTELGPISVTPDEIKDNPYAWSKRANIIFMESPAGVGFSYAVDGDLVADDDSTAKQNHRALQSFFEKFPQYKGRDLYLTGESYGGVYLPTLAVLVDEDPSMNLKGVAIGNGYLDANKLAESLVFFSYYHGLVGKSIWEGLTKECCQGKPPARGMCQFIDPKRSAACGAFVTDATDAILGSGLNPYNLYDHCAVPTTSDAQPSFTIGREHFDKSLLMHAFNVTQRPDQKKYALRPRRGSPKSSNLSKQQGVLFQRLRGDPPCTDDSVVINFLNRPQTRAELNIPQDMKRPFTTCADDIQYTMIYPASRDGLAPQIRKLIKSPRKLKLLVYNGDIDMMCNFFGDEWFVDDLQQKLLADWEAWHVAGQVAGFVKHYEGITYMTVKGSGHMVPTDKPAEALAMFETFVYGHQKE